MKGYVTAKRGRYYAVIYEGLDPVTGRERRTWHPAGDRSGRGRTARRAARRRVQRTQRRGPIAHLRRLPDQAVAAGQEAHPADQHLPRLRPQDRTPHPPRPRHHPAARSAAPAPRDPLRPDAAPQPTARRALAPKTVYEVHLIIRGALGDAVRRGLITRNVALVAHAPRLRSIPKVEQQAWTAEQLPPFLRAAAGHRLFPALWLSAMTGMRRSELLGLRWTDIDFDKATVSINRGLVAIGYELHESRGQDRQLPPPHRPRPHHHHRPPRLAGPAGRRIRRRRHRRPRLGVRRRRRPTDPPARHLPDLRADRPPRRRPRDPTARPAPHPRHAAHQGPASR